jgi:hypothetical protein
MAVARIANLASMMRLRLMEKFAMAPLSLVPFLANTISSARTIRSASGAYGVMSQIPAWYIEEFGWQQSKRAMI